MTTTYAKMSKAVRAAVNASGTSYPIRIVDGSAAAPELVGESHHYVTPGGKPVYHPNAYRRAWGKPIYVSSTRAITVGRDWLFARGLIAMPSAKSFARSRILNDVKFPPVNPYGWNQLDLPELVTDTTAA